MKGDRVFISDAFFPLPLEALTKRLVNDKHLPDLLKGGNFLYSPCTVETFLLRDHFSFSLILIESKTDGSVFYQELAC